MLASTEDVIAVQQLYSAFFQGIDRNVSVEELNAFWTRDASMAYPGGAVFTGDELRMKNAETWTRLRDVTSSVCHRISNLVVRDIDGTLSGTAGLHTTAVASKRHSMFGGTALEVGDGYLLASNCDVEVARTTNGPRFSFMKVTPLWVRLIPAAEILVI
jgi:hypothetical protein